MFDRSSASTGLQTDTSSAASTAATASGGRWLRPARAAVVPVLALAVFAGACSSDKKPAAAPATTVATATSATQNVAQASNKEVTNVSMPRPYIDKLTAALKANDLAGAKAALEGYDSTWNGVEVYVNVRSLSLYLKVEADLQAQLTDGLAKPSPNFAELATASDTLGKRYDEAIALSKNGPALSPLFDDLATLRSVRAELSRIVTPALAANDKAKATAHFNTFKSNFQQAYDLMKVRSPEAADATKKALDDASAKFTAGGTVDELKAVVGPLTTKYNFGVNLVNAAARNADPTRTTVNDVDLLRLNGLADVEIQLNKSLAAWQQGDFARSGSVAAAVGTSAFPRVQPALASKGSDVVLKKAIDDYTALAGAAGDATKVTAANKAALDAVAVARQVLVGQFWTDAKVQSYIASLPKPDALK
jgi:hypothetical protein